MAPWPSEVTIRVQDHFEDVRYLVKEVYTHPERRWESKGYHLWDAILNVACLRLRSMADANVRLSVWPQPRVCAEDPADPDGSSFAGSFIPPEAPRRSARGIIDHMSVDDLFEQSPASSGSLAPSFIEAPIRSPSSTSSTLSSLSDLTRSISPEHTPTAEEIESDDRRASRTTDFSTILKKMVNEDEDEDDPEDDPEDDLGLAPFDFQKSTPHLSFELKPLKANNESDYRKLTGLNTRKSVAAARIAKTQLLRAGPQVMRQAQYSFEKYKNRSKLTYVVGMGMWWIALSFRRSAIGKTPSGFNTAEPSYGEFLAAVLALPAGPALSIFNAAETDLHSELKRLMSNARNWASTELSMPAIA